MSNLISLIRSGDYMSAIIFVASTAFVVFCCLPLHELAHAYVANKCGDDTARLKGRLTIDPFAHLDLFGTIMIFLFGIGYAKPVPVNPAKLKHPRRDMALVSLAGPVSNLLMSFVSVTVHYAIVFFFDTGNKVAAVLASFFYIAAAVNSSLAIFNLLPIPPLDGAKIFSAILPDKIYFKIMSYDRYIMIGLMVLLFTGVLDGVISFLSTGMLRIISYLPILIFGALG